MKPISSQPDFELALKAESTVIFIHFPRSEQSTRARQLVEQWEEELSSQSASPKFTIHLLEPDVQPYTWKWVGKETDLGDNAGGNDGTILWLRRGTVAGGLQNVSQADTKTLFRITDECFVQGKSPGLFSPSHEIPPFDLELLKILCCPETRQKLELAAPAVLEKLNQQIAAGNLRNRTGRVLEEKVTAGLVRADGKYLYPMQQNIPILLVDEAIPLTR